MFARPFARIAALSALLGLAQIAAAQCQPTWHAGPAGTTGSQDITSGLVYASCLWVPDSNPNTTTRLVVGGTLSGAGGISSPHIASWDGTAWYAFGSGMNGNVNAVVAIGNTLYAGGQFTTANGVACSNIARWTGTTWAPVGTGTNGAIFAMANVNGTLFVGGSFTTAGGVAAGHAAAWDGFSWQSLGPGLNGNVLSILNDNPTGVVFGGEFTQAGTTPVSHIALYDNSWHPIGAGIGSNVNALALYNNQIWAGGPFADANGQATFVAGLTYWNGATWNAIQTPQGIGVSSTHVGPHVDSFAVLNNTLYIGGLFDTCAGQPTPGIAAFDNNGVHALGAGIAPPTAEVFAMSPFQNSIYALGDFFSAGGLPVSDIARWNGTEWSRLQSQPTASVLALAIVNGGLIAGGSFNFQTSPGTFARYLVGYSTSGGVGPFMNQGGFTGTNGPVFAACQVNPVSPFLPPTAVIAGNFTSAGGQSCSNIASLSATSDYGAMGPGLNAQVNAVIQYSNQIYAAGYFSASGATAVHGVGKYTSSGWVPAGTTGVTGGTPFVLTNYNGNMYMGGDFTGVDGLNTGGIARWNGTSWNIMGGHFLGTVYALAVYNGQLIIGGTFPGTQNSPNIASWDGTAYHGLGVGLGTATTDQYITALAVHNGELYAAGHFTMFGFATDLAKWDGLSWTPMDTSIDAGYIDALVSFNGELWAGGFFPSSGGHFDPYIARFFCTCYANCDNSSAAPVLNANDFNCFLNAYAGGLPYANCDGSVTPPTLTANDFQCFLNKFAAGCN